MITSSATSQNWKMWDQKGKKVNDKMWKAKLIFSICCLLECSGGYESKHHLIIPKKNPKKKKAWRPSVGQKHLTKVQPFPYQTRIVHFDWHLGSKAWKKTTTIVKGHYFLPMSSPKSSLLKLPTGSQKKLAKNLSYFRLFSCPFGFVCHYQHTSMRFLLVLLSLSLSLSLNEFYELGFMGFFPSLPFGFSCHEKRDSWIPLDHAQSEHKCVTHYLLCRTLQNILTHEHLTSQYTISLEI